MIKTWWQTMMEFPHQESENEGIYLLGWFFNQKHSEKKIARLLHEASTLTTSASKTYKSSHQEVLSRIGVLKIQTRTVAVDPKHLKVKFAEYDFPNRSYVINRTSYCPMLITYKKSNKNWQSNKRKSIKIKILGHLMTLYTVLFQSIL